MLQPPRRTRMKGLSPYITRSLKRYFPPPELRVSAVAQRREETLDVVPELRAASLPADVRAVFEVSPARRTVLQTVLTP